MPDSSETRSVHDSETFNVGDKTLRERTERPVIDHDNLCHEKIFVNEADMDFRIPGLPHSVVKHAQSTSVRELIQKIENHQIDMLFNKIYDKIIHITLSVQNQRKWFKMWATSNYVNCSRRNLKRSAQHAYHTGIQASSIARAGIS